MNLKRLDLSKFDSLSNHLLSLSAAIIMVLFFTFVLRARLVLGHWPTYSNPDPKNLGMGLHYGCIWIGIYLLFWAILSKFLHTFIFTHRSLLLKTIPLFTLGGFILFISGDHLGTVMCASLWSNLVLTVLFPLVFLAKRQFNLLNVLFLVTLVLFWAHNILDPFKFVDWFID